MKKITLFCFVVLCMANNLMAIPKKTVVKKTTAITQANIKTAVDAWVADPTTAEATYGHIKDWDVSNVTDMTSLFEEKGSFNEDISAWNVSNVTTMKNMFYKANAFNADLSNWDVSSVTDMHFVFHSAMAFNADISNWDVSNVTNMQSMFFQSFAFNQDIGDWDVSNVTTMETMFFNALAFNQDIGGWDVSNVTNMFSMFAIASAFNQDLSGWCVSNIANEPPGFSSGSALTETHKPVWGTCPTLTTSEFDITAINIYVSNGSQLNIAGTTNSNNLKVEVYNILGKRVKIYQLKKSKTNVIISLSNLEKGIYIVKLNTKDIRKIKKVLIQ